jgi:FAD synthase
MDLIEFNKEIYNDTLEMMKVDYIRDDETYNKIIKNTIEKNKEEIYLDINQIRNEIKRDTEPNIPFLLLLSSLI